MIKAKQASSRMMKVFGEKDDFEEAKSILWILRAKLLI